MAASLLLLLAACAGPLSSTAPVVPLLFVDGTACSAVPTSASRLLTCSHAVPDVEEGLLLLDDGPHQFRVLRRGAPRSRFEPPEWLSTDPNAASRVPDLALDWALLEVDPPLPPDALAGVALASFDFDGELPPGSAVTVSGFLPERASDDGAILERRVDLSSLVFPRTLAGVDPPPSVFAVASVDRVEADRGGMSGGAVTRRITDVDWPTNELEIVGICHGTLVTFVPETNETLFVGCIVVRPPRDAVR